MTTSANEFVGNRPFGRLDSGERLIYDSVDDLAFQGEYDMNNNLIYKGFARAGSDTADPVWQIAKLTYDGSNNLVTITWPESLIGYSIGNPSTDYEFIWDNRAALTYV